MKTLTPEEHGILAYGMDFGFPPFDLNCACDLEGIITGVNFDIAEPKRRIVTRTKWDRLNHIHYILSKGSPSEMSEGKFNDLMELMLRVSGELSENPDPRSKLERRIAEVLIERNRNMEAIGHLEKALSLKPKVGVKKLLERMKSE